MSKNIKSESASIENLRRFFKDTTKDTISLHEALLAWGRENPHDIEINRNWLNSIMTHIRYHNLITSVYKYNDSRKKLDGFRLTMRGKRALGRIGSESEIEDHATPSTNEGSRIITLEEIAEAIPRLREKHTMFNIVFSVTPKE